MKKLGVFFLSIFIFNVAYSNEKVIDDLINSANDMKLYEDKAWFQRPGW